MADNNTIQLNIEGTKATVNKINDINIKLKQKIEFTTDKVNKLSQSGNFTSLASDAAVANYNSLKSKFEEFYETINMFKMGLEQQSEDTHLLDQQSASNLS